MHKLTPVPGATSRYDDDGNEIVEIATCGHCGRSWNDAAISGVTPVPSGRCPFEYEHEDPDDEYQRRDDLITKALGIAPGETLRIEIDIEEGS